MGPSVRPSALVAVAFAVAVAVTTATAARAQSSPPVPRPTPAGPAHPAARDTARPAVPPADTPPGAPGPDEARVEHALVARLDSVDAAGKAGITAMAVPTAVSLIESIRPALQTSDRAVLRSIAADLDALREELGARAVNGRRVGAILRRIGPKVTTVARTQSGALRAALHNIGEQLTAAGGRLAPGDRA